MPSSSPTILFLGARGNSGNKGVVALTASLAGLVLREIPEANIAYLLFQRAPERLHLRIDGKDRTFDVHNCCLGRGQKPSQNLAVLILVSLFSRALPLRPVRTWIFRRFPLLALINDANLVGDIRGGDSFSDLYGRPRFLRASLISFLVMIWRSDVVMLPQTYGPFQSSVARFVARRTLRRAKKIIARDSRSMEAAKSVARRTDVQLSPDVAFSLYAERPSAPLFMPELPPGRRPVGINVNGLMYNGGYSRKNMFGLSLQYVDFVADLIAAFLRSCDEPIVLVPHTFSLLGDVESDTEACIKARNRLNAVDRRRVHVLMDEFDASSIKGVIGQCDFFVGSRMHSCIAALSQGIPCVGVAYSMKFQGVFESVGVGDWVVDGRTTTNEAAIQHILDLYRRRDAVRGELARQADAARTRLRDVFAGLIADIGSRHQ